jgi:hypothetical protein
MLIKIDIRNVKTILVEKCLGTKQLRRRNCKWECNIKTYIKEMNCGGEGRI